MSLCRAHTGTSTSERSAATKDLCFQLGVFDVARLFPLLQISVSPFPSIIRNISDLRDVHSSSAAAKHLTLVSIINKAL